MARKSSLGSWLSLDELRAQAEGCTDAVLRSRWQAIRLVAEGATSLEAGQQVGLAGKTVREWVRRFREHGPAGIVDGRRRPRPHKRLLSLAQQNELATLLAQEAPGGGPWTGPKIAAVMGEWLGRPVAPVVAWGYFFHLGFRAPAVKVAEQAAKPAADTVRRQRPDDGAGPPVPRTQGLSHRPE